jgi:tRNA threonylcarbamoyladenosine biosynthesis protein TsaB
MRILAVDTTTQRGSVALFAGDVEGELRQRSALGHSSRLVPAIALLLEGLGLEPVDVDAYVVATGPGPFTGLRVGIGTVQGLGLASGRPCLGISALEALAARMRGCAPYLVPVMDAWRGEVFSLVCDAEARPLGPPRVEAPESLLARVPEDVAFLGEGAERYRVEILARRPRAVFPERGLFLAATLARLAAPRLAAGEGRPAEELRPLYLRDADIRRPA